MVSKMSMGILSPYHMLMNWLFRVNDLFRHCNLAQKGLGFIGYFGKSTLDILDT